MDIAGCGGGGGGGGGMVWYGICGLGLSASLLAGRIAETPLPQLFPGPGQQDSI